LTGRKGLAPLAEVKATRIFRNFVADEAAKAASPAPAVSLPGAKHLAGRSARRRRLLSAWASAFGRKQHSASCSAAVQSAVVKAVETLGT
jgi:hypothetical protein